jgi:predicted enzyme related to lactoylglutathione lyase
MTSAASLALSPIVAFVTIHNPERAKMFYRDVLGLPLMGEELPYALVFDCNGTMLRLAIDPESPPIRGTVLCWRVTSIEATVRALMQVGVVFERWDFMPQDELGIWSTPTGAKVAWFKDSEGNLLSVSQMSE